VAWPRLEPPVLSAIDHIGRHYGDPPTVGALARASGVSADQLNRLFHEALGIGAKSYLVNFRLAVAQHLMAHTGRSVDDVAEMTGFADASHFSRAFKSRTGSRPGEYRRDVGNS
jgi:transcriptional regulator GlxA family with amidase domain